LDNYRNNMRVLKSSNCNLYNIIRDYNNSDKVIIRKDDLDDNIEALIEDKENNIKIYLEKTKSDDYTIRVEKNDRDIYFHSKYAPLKEAKREIKEFKAKDNKQVFALGFGLGYSLNELARKNQYDRIFIIEPFISIFYTALKFVDLEEILKSKNIIYIIGSTEPLFDVIRKYFSLTMEKKLSFLEHGPSHNLFKDEYKDIYQKIREGINYKKTSLVTNIKRAREWRNNIIINLPYIFKSPKADDFFDEFEDVPAICVAAGPSLDKNIGDIKKAEGKAIIMCVGTALKALLQNDIEPDIVVSMDGRKGAYRQFEDAEISNRMFLFSELGNQYRINKNWNGNQVFFTMKRNFSGWVENINGNYTSIRTGGTVAHSMVDLAYKMGANPIILAGQDLSYSKEKTHAKGTVYEDRKVKNNDLIEADGVNGDKVLTSKSFMTMLSYFNNYFAKRPDRKYIDATEGGAKIKNTEIQSMKDAIKKYCNKDIDTNVIELLTNKFENEKPEIPEEKIKNAIKDLFLELNEAIELSNKQLVLLKKMENRVKHANSLSNIKSNEFKTELKTLENQIKSLKNIKYFTERILIVETMKYNEVKSNYYISEIKKFQEEIKYYRTYRVQFAEEIKKCKNLLKKLYIRPKKQEELV